jgi:D-alanine-D-alanine ligase
MINLALLFGGISPEHEISVISAKSVYANLTKGKYIPILIGITKGGKWNLFTKEEFESLKTVTDKGQELTLPLNNKKGINLNNEFIPFDCVFPVLHGKGGEDGLIQGLLELCSIPYVGADTESSSLCMNKILTKKVLNASDIKQADYLHFFKEDFENNDKSISKIISKLKLPLFVKPANTGSSIGISKVSKVSELKEAIKLAFNYSREVIIEKAINAREIECSVLGDFEHIEASYPGEIIPKRDFYDYEAKYVDTDTELVIPANLDETMINRVKETSKICFKLLGCYGIARVDFLLDKETNELYVNEINTIPGFTSISMYPKLWEYSGIPYNELIDKLVYLAFQRNKSEF